MVLVLVTVNGKHACEPFCLSSITAIHPSCWGQSVDHKIVLAQNGQIHTFRMEYMYIKPIKYSEESVRVGALKLIHCIYSKYWYKIYANIRLGQFVYAFFPFDTESATLSFCTKNVFTLDFMYCYRRHIPCDSIGNYLSPGYYVIHHQQHITRTRRDRSNTLLM